MSIPVIDIDPYLRGGDEDKRMVARQIAAACEESGFFCVVGHGVPAGLIARTRQAAADFFALPVAEKRSILRPESRVGRGYYPFADRSLAYTLGVETPPDLQEAYAMGPPEHSRTIPITGARSRNISSPGTGTRRGPKTSARPWTNTSAPCSGWAAG